jgi:hypothetical protein
MKNRANSNLSILSMYTIYSLTPIDLSPDNHYQYIFTLSLVRNPSRISNIFLLYAEFHKSINKRFSHYYLTLVHSDLSFLARFIIVPINPLSSVSIIAAIIFDLCANATAHVAIRARAIIGCIV